MLKRTPLWPDHQRLGARLVEFGGWEMPVQYAGIVSEHLAVRSGAGLFDISHMGEFLVEGAGALEFLNTSLTNDLRKCEVGRGQYTLLCNERGGVIDDLYAYRLDREQFLLIVNASRIDADFAWVSSRLSTWPSTAPVNLTNASEDYGAVAVQGPRVIEFIDPFCQGPADGGRVVMAPSELKKNEIGHFKSMGQSVWIGRTGYTGEDGFEVIASAKDIRDIWARLLTLGQSVGLKPCGLGARDTLRTEMGYPLYGHELDEGTTPLEAGLGVFVALDKGEFLGRSVLVQQKADGVQKKCVAFELTEKAPPPRPQYPIWSAGQAAKIGTVVSGTQSPSLGIGIGMGYVPPDQAKPGTKIEIEVRGKFVPARIVPKPIYRKPTGG